MTEWSRRSLLRVSAGAAVAVPMAALGSTTASAVTPTAVAAGAAGRESAAVAALPDEPVMFCIHDAQRGEVSILHGSNEVIVRDRQLVARILTAAGSARA